jgi:cyclopropane-fatty-acyl-phospholipid synthase
MLSKQIVKRVFKYMSRANGDVPLKIVFPDGKEYQTASGAPKVTIVFKSKAVLRRSVLLDQIGLIEGYMQGLIDIKGHDALHELIKIGYNAGKGKSHHRGNPLSTFKVLRLEARTNNKNRRQAELNAFHHYGMPAEFFRLFLGETYGYTEGYYENGDESLDEAQRKKFDYVCRKLRLQKGDKLVEVGAGWGYMSVLAAEKYGAEVVNYGLVEEQNKVMQRSIDEKGLNDKVKIVVKDHRELLNEPETYDKYVSIGVYEHAGLDCQEEWIKSIAACLKPGGTGVISTLCHMNRQRTNYIIDKYIFPGGNMPGLADTIKYMEDNGLTILDMESMRPHYLRALEDWYDLFVKNWPEIQKINPGFFNEGFRRLWSVYLLGSIEGFNSDSQRLNVFHIVFTKGRNLKSYPNKRDFLYANHKRVQY